MIPVLYKIIVLKPFWNTYKLILLNNIDKIWLNKHGETIVMVVYKYQ